MKSILLIIKQKKGNDHYHSMDYKDLKNFFENLKLINIIEGKKRKDPLVQNLCLEKMQEEALL